MGAESLSELAAKLRVLPSLGEQIAKEAAPDVLAIAKATAAAGTDPYGVPWAPRLKDGGKALQHAADAITVETAHDVILLCLLDPVHIAHQFKTSKSLAVARKILPDIKAGDPIPPRMVEAIRQAAARVLARTL